MHPPPALLIDGGPKIVALAINLHEDLVEVPFPAAGFQSLDPPLPDLRSEHRAETMPPEPHVFAADLNTALV